MQTLFLTFAFPGGANISVNWIELDLGSSVAPTATPTLTPTPTPLSGGIWRRIEAESFTSGHPDVTRYGTSDPQGGVQDAGNYGPGDWMAFSNQDLGGGVLRFRLRGNGPTSGSGTISLRVGSQTGTILCTLSWPTTTSYTTSNPVTCNGAATGVQTLYLVNDSVPWVNVNWIEVEVASGVICPPAAQALGLQSGETTTQSTDVCQLPTSTPTTPPLPNQRGLRVSYYNNASLQGTPVINHYSPAANTPFLFNFGSGGPTQFGGTSTDNFSLSYEGMIWIPSNGSYTFYVSSDDGVVLKIGGIGSTPVTNDWNRAPSGANPIPPGNATNSIALNSGFYEISIDYREFTLSASIEIQWEQTLGASPFSRRPLTFENLYLPNGTLTPPTPVPSTTPVPTNYNIIIANTGSGEYQQWSPDELTAINAGVDQVGRALDRVSQIANTSQDAFNRVYDAGSIQVFDGVLFVRGDSTTNIVRDPQPDIEVTFTYQGQNYTMIFPDINRTICKSFEAQIYTSGASQLTISNAVVCNGPLDNLAIGGNNRASEYTIVHELGHILDYRSSNSSVGMLTDGIASGYSLGSCASQEFFGSNYVVIGYVSASIPFSRGSRGWGSTPIFSTFHQSPENTALEAAADMFLNWVYRSNNVSGTSRVTGVSTQPIGIPPAPQTGCIVISDQTPGNQFSETWNGFLNCNWGAAGSPFDWGLPGEVRHTYMVERMNAVFIANSW